MRESCSSYAELIRDSSGDYYVRTDLDRDLTVSTKLDQNSTTHPG